MKVAPLTYPHPRARPAGDRVFPFVNGGSGGHLVHLAKGNRMVCRPAFYVFETDIELENPDVKITCEKCKKRQHGN